MNTGTTGVSPANGVSDLQETAVPTSRRVKRWPFVLVAALVIILAAAAITGAALGSSYQPVRFGGFGGGLSHPIITRQVNNFPPMDGQTYLPPQKSARGGWTVSLSQQRRAPCHDRLGVVEPTVGAGTNRPAGPATARYGRTDVLAGKWVSRGTGKAARRNDLEARPSNCCSPACHDCRLLDASSRVLDNLHILGQGEVHVLDPPGPDLVDQPL
jgi:hypothetical protein